MKPRILACLLISTLAFFGCKRAAPEPAGPPTETVFQIEGMTCDGCTKAITSAVQRHPGVVSCEVSLSNKTAVVTGHAEQIDFEKMCTQLERMGFSATQP